MRTNLSIIADLPELLEQGLISFTFNVQEERIHKKSPSAYPICPGSAPSLSWNSFVQESPQVTAPMSRDWTYIFSLNLIKLTMISLDNLPGKNTSKTYAHQMDSRDLARWTRIHFILTRMSVNISKKTRNQAKGIRLDDEIAQCWRHDHIGSGNSMRSRIVLPFPSNS